MRPNSRLYILQCAKIRRRAFKNKGIAAIAMPLCFATSVVYVLLYCLNSVGMKFARSKNYAESTAANTSSRARSFALASLASPTLLHFLQITKVSAASLCSVLCPFFVSFTAAGGISRTYHHIIATYSTQ
jgi:hypothetical protein